MHPSPSSLLSLRSLLFLLLGSSLSGWATGQGYKSIEMRLEEEAAAAAAATAAAAASTTTTTCMKNAECPNAHVCQDDGDGYRLKGDQACMGACSCVPGKREKATDRCVDDATGLFLLAFCCFCFCVFVCVCVFSCTHAHTSLCTRTFHNAHVQQQLFDPESLSVRCGGRGSGIDHWYCSCCCFLRLLID